MTTATVDNAAPMSVVNVLYASTKQVHTEVERSGVIIEILRGEASRDSVILLQRNLLAAYEALEAGLERHRGTPALAPLAGFRFDHALALQADLRALCGGDFSHVPLLSEGKAYAHRIEAAADGNAELLIAHAYTRYLGDLSGGQIVKQLLAKKPGLKPDELTFYDFEGHADLAALKTNYRQALDDAGRLAADPQAIVDEGMLAFSLNTDLSWAVKNALLPA